jgi:murein DD-endopeptidase MepM/ murein hydrolase activator NlpD
VSGTLAGEPLHFTPDSGGTWTALGGLPIDATGAVDVPVLVEYASGRVDTVAAELPVAAGQYAMEKLTVAPRFGSPPDSALAARMARESARARAVSQQSHSTPKMWDSTWIRPRDTRITSGFGHGREFNGRVQSRHMGVDFAGAVGTPIRAANRGVVALVDEFYLGGNVIYIDHGAGVVTAYLHLSQHEVAQGDTVERGQIIGRVGATGRVTGPHLHWIARYGGITVNPLSLTELPPLTAAQAEQPDAPKSR